MDEQVNIPALGIFCFSVRVFEVQALYGYTFGNIEIEPSGSVNLSGWGA